MILLLIGGIVLLSCSNTKKNKNKSKKHDVEAVSKDHFLNVLMDSDTLETKQEKGVVKFFSKVNDTLKIDERDTRHLYIVLGLMPHKDNKTSFTPNDKFSREINFSRINNSRDTIEIPFDIIPNFKGKGTIIGFITDTYELHSYFKDDKIRILTDEYNFNQDVFIK
ncbi:MAG: hypothetical protein JKY22_09115 [Flavobacteriaceae bacterium]|nr:hypothetical protein [Flavobacteriaceae bacterium]